MPTSIGLIGFGSFGKFIAQHLNMLGDLFVYDPFIPDDEVIASGHTPVSLSVAAAAKVVILAVPAQNLKSLLPYLATSINPNALVLDVASVKVLPLQWIENELPKSVEILGTHPLFGPQSGANGLQGLNITLCPVRISNQKVESIVQILKDKFGLKVFVQTPDEHDKNMAYVQALSHFFSRGLRQINLPEIETRTKAYDNLLEMSRMLRNDTEALFVTIQKYNPYAAQVREQLMNSLSELKNWLDGLTDE